MAEILERDNRRYLVRKLKARGGELRKVKWVSRRGAPDELVLMFGEWSCFVELKRPKEDLEDYQLREHRRLKAAFIPVVKLNSYADIDRFLEKGPNT